MLYPILIPFLVRQDSQLCHLIWACHVFQGFPQFWSGNLATALVIPEVATTSGAHWYHLLHFFGEEAVMIMISLPEPRLRESGGTPHPPKKKKQEMNIQRCHVSMKKSLWCWSHTCNLSGLVWIQGATGRLHSLSFTCRPRNLTIPAQPGWCFKDMGVLNILKSSWTFGVSYLLRQITSNCQITSSSNIIACFWGASQWQQQLSAQLILSSLPALFGLPISLQSSLKSTE